MGCAVGPVSESPRIPASLDDALKPDPGRPAPCLPASPPIWLAGYPDLHIGPALPAMEPQVALLPASFRRCRFTDSGLPRLRPFGIADDPFSGSPRIADLPAPAGGLPRIASWPRLPVLPSARSPGLPGSLSAGLAFRGTSGLPRLFPSAGGADWSLFPSRPESWAFSACRRTSLPGCPGAPALRPR